MLLKRLVVLLIFLFVPFWQGLAQNSGLAAEAEEVMLEATRYMVEEVSTNGGYVSHYKEDFSRRWAEIEAYDTQIWIQPPRGTVGMGHLFLDAYEVIGEPYYYQAAEKVARALIWGQQESGGWNYIVDLAGDRSLQKFYNTIGANAWGFEEYYHYYGNATMDDNVTAGAARFLLRIYLQKLDPTLKPALDKAIGFILMSQYPLGGWPQRYPLMNKYSKGGFPDYSSFYTFNDGVIRNNITFLINCYVTLGEERFLDPIRRGMNFYLISQQGNPQGGWGKQHNMELEPASARTYEPPALVPGRTVDNLEDLLWFYELTGERKFLDRIPDALDWLERSRLSECESDGGRYTHSRFVEVGTNRSLYIHRQREGVEDGHGIYWTDYDHENTISYGGKSNLNSRIEAIRNELRRLETISPEEAVKGSLLQSGQHGGGTPQEKHLSRTHSGEAPNPGEVREILNAIDIRGRWLSTGEVISDPYMVDEQGRPCNTAIWSVEFDHTTIPDSTDQKYITTRLYIQYMTTLLNYIAQQ